MSFYQLDTDEKIKNDTHNICDVSLLKLYEENNIVELLNDKHKNNKQIIFMEGPPFISGSGKKDDEKQTSGLHLGHCLVSEIKSCMIKYYNLQNLRCDMITGTDNHGLPIETFVSKLLNLNTPSDIIKYGIPKFNAVCKETILKYEKLWDPVYTNIGRMVDTTHRYKTMDTKYMESVFWAFKTLYDKNMIYLGLKVVPYSYKCATVLSNFEASQNYQDVTENTAYVYFPLKNNEKCGFVAWTTTPWTLPSNVALCLHPEGKYVKVFDGKREYIVHENFVNNLRLKIVSVSPCGTGNDLVGTEYVHPMKSVRKTYKTIVDTFVETTGDIGTGIVHIAPTHGEIDYDVCMKNNIISVDEIVGMNIVDDDGNFSTDYLGLKGKNVFDANPLIIDMLKFNNMLVTLKKYTHSYPYSDRTGEPLIYRAMPCYFVRVTAIKEKLLEMNKKINWFPKHVGVGRFQNWLENARDWAISRTRFFGTPLPIWKSDDGTEEVCIGSIEELVKLAHLKETLTDLHPEFLDKITITSSSGKILRRINYTLDCWFESGCVPYGQIHYPFENQHIFDNREYLADFVCEGIDQTRGWFYTLLVLSTALLDKPAYKNVICTGLILDKTGKKLSKRSGNFVDPQEIVNKYGSDAVRMYLLNSVAVQADNLLFNEEDIKIMKCKIVQWLNGVRFFIEHYLAHIKTYGDTEINIKETNKLDEWILARTNEFSEKFKCNMGEFNINICGQQIQDYIEDFTNIYLKLNRPRIKGLNGRYEQETSLAVINNVLHIAIRVMLPFMPMTSDYIYKHIKSFEMKQEISLHLCEYPKNPQSVDMKIIEMMTQFTKLLTESRRLRSMKKEFLSIRKPIKKMYVMHNNKQFLNFVEDMRDTLLNEMNCIELVIGDSNEYLKLGIKVNKKEFGKKFKQCTKNERDIIQQIQQLELIENYGKQFCIKVTYNNMMFELTNNEIEIVKEVNNMFGENVMTSLISDIVLGDMILAVDLNVDEKLLEKYIIKQLVIAVQTMRKDSNLHPWDKIVVSFCSGQFEKNISDNLSYLHSKLACDIGHYENIVKDTIVEKQCDMYDFDGKILGSIKIRIEKL